MQIYKLAIEMPIKGMGKDRKRQFVGSEIFERPASVRTDISIRDTWLRNNYHGSQEMSQ